MIVICAMCGYENEASQPACARCGAELILGGHTPIIDTDKLVERVKTNQRTVEGLGLYGAPTVVTLRIESGELVRVRLGQETTLGRGEASHPPGPDVDLSPYGAQTKGVSRVHAVIHNLGNVLTLTDLGSKNGTMLNGELLTPERPRVIKANDEIRFGRLAMRIEFDD